MAIFPLILCSINLPLFFRSFISIFLQEPPPRLSYMSTLHFHCAPLPLAMSTRASVRKSNANTQGPRLSRKGPPAKRRGRGRKATDEEEDDDAAGSKPVPRVIWNAKRTELLVEWLENNVEDRQRLFSDSAHDAREENRRPRTAKSVKTSFHVKMAAYIFSVDEDAKVRDDLKARGAKRYAKAVENRITR